MRTHIQSIYKIILLYCFIFSSTTGYAQFYPVTATPQLIPPYSLQLSEYQTTFAEKLRLTLVLNDANNEGRQIRLHWGIESNTGVSIQSTPVVIGAAPLFLDGTTLQITNADLQSYFALQNLQGVTPQQYGRPLPEGVYRFCVTVFDQLTGRQLSAQSCATAYFALNDPPFLNLPNKGEHIPMRDPQNIVFQWTPRHLNATNVQYEFTLAELWNDRMDPQAAFLASRPLYQTTSFAPTLLYGPAEPLLLEDKNYAWRVRAIVSDGISETASFKNNGYSEIYHFVYTGQCSDPKYILAEAKTPTSQNILWQGEDHIQYNVQYRKKNITPSGGRGVWFDGNTQNENLTINSLKPNVTYEFRVGGQCIEGGGYTYSQIYEFTTTLRQAETATYTCGITPEIQITNREALAQLERNEQFTAGDFVVTVLDVNGSAGNFSGWGFIIVPYLQDTKLKVVFDNIQLNTDYQLIAGMVVTDYDEDFATEEGNAGMDDITDELEFISALGKEILELLKNFKGTPEEIAQLEEKNRKQLTETEQLLANPNVSEQVKEDIKQYSKESENLDNQLIADASENGPNPEGYNTDAQQQAQTRLNYSIAEAQQQIEKAKEEEEEYEENSLIQKILLEIRCGKVNNLGTLEISYLSRLPQSGALQLEKNENTPNGSYQYSIYLELKDTSTNKLNLNKSITKETGSFKIKQTDITGVFTTFEKSFKYKYTIDNLILYADQPNLKPYLSPTIDEIESSFDTVWNQININDGIGGEEWALLKSIAACDAGFIEPNERYKVIKAIYNAHKSWLKEPVEDLILDLIKTCALTDATQFLGYLKDDFELFEGLYSGMSDSGGNEKNNTRFLITLFNLWKSSDFSNPEYTEYSYQNVPRVLSYDGKSTLYRGFSFRELYFELDKKTKKIKVIKEDTGDLDDQIDEIYNYQYDIFQPISIWYVDKKDRGKFIDGDMPVFFFMGLEDIEDLNARRKSIGLTTDVALMFTGVGNIAHIKKLSGAYRFFKGVIAGIEIASPTVDLVIEYTSACKGSEEFCTKLKTYNFWLQMATLSTDILVSRMVKKSAQDAYKTADNTVDQEIIDHLKKVGDEFSNAGGAFKQVTKTIAKQELPSDFVNALKKMDLPEDEILKRFTKYHNENDFRFFNEVKDLMKQYPQLNKTDVNLLWGYTTNIFYKNLNFWLREGTNLSKTKAIRELLNTSLAKMETFNQTLIYRGIGRSGNPKQYLDMYLPNSTHTWDAFTSCGSSIEASFIAKSDVIFQIKHLDAKDISDFADGIKFRDYPPHELLIRSGAEFRVISNDLIDEVTGKNIIELIQIK